MKKHPLSYLVLSILLLASTQIFANLRIESVNGGNIKIVGGEADDAAALAFGYCKEKNDFFQSTPLIQDQFTIFGRARFYKCSFLESPANLSRPTSLQQREMQTRKFSKPVAEVIKAVNGWARDAGFSGLIDSSGKGSITINSDTALQVLGIGISIAPLTKDTTAIRINTSQLDPSASMSYQEFFSTKTYQKIFNAIAEQLFTQAIPMDPAEIK